MRKSDIVQFVADEADIPNRQAEAAVAAVLEQITNALSRGDSVTLVGFGTFDVKARAARTGRNPKNGEPIEIAGRNQPVFKPGKALKDALK